MTLHIVKLCVGCGTLEDLAGWQSQRLAGPRRDQEPAELMHVTRQTPRRLEIGPRSSIYWVMGGYIRARQRITGLRELRGSDGISRCGLVLDPKLIATEPSPRRPFQGWRYLPDTDVPSDLSSNEPLADDGMPPRMRAALKELHLI